MTEEKIKKPIWKKWWVWVIAIIILGSIAGSEDDNKTTSIQTSAPQTQAQSKETAKPQPENTAENQKLVKDFEQALYAKENSVKPIMDNYQKVMGQLGKTKTIYEAYEAAKAAKEAAKKLKGEFYLTKVPENLPEEIQKLLNGAAEDLGTAYYTKEKAFDAVMLFLDDQKPSNMDKFKEEISSSESFTISAVEKLLLAKQKVGIDLSKK